MIYKTQQENLKWDEKSEEETKNQAKKWNQKWGSIAQVVSLGIMLLFTQQASTLFNW